MSGWRKSSFSNVNDCVEVAFAGDVVRVRNSRDRSLPFLSFTVADWAGFVASVRAAAMCANCPHSAIDHAYVPPYACRLCSCSGFVNAGFSG